MVNNTIAFDLNLSAGQVMDVCELNQFRMLESLQKLPEAYFLFVLLAFVALIIYMWVLPKLFNLPSFKKRHKLYGQLRHTFLAMTLGSLVWAMVFGALVTFKLDEKVFSAITIILIIILIILAITFFIKNRKKFPGWFKKAKKELEEIDEGEEGT